MKRAVKGTSIIAISTLLAMLLSVIGIALLVSSCSKPADNEEWTRMEKVDVTLSELVNSDDFKSRDLSNKENIMRSKLNELIQKGLIKVGSVDYYDGHEKVFWFEYADGGIGGITIEKSSKPIELMPDDFEDYFLNTLRTLNKSRNKYSFLSSNSIDTASCSAIITYGWFEWGYDDVKAGQCERSYSNLQRLWESYGITTTLNKSPTVLSYRSELLNKDLIVFATHGTMYKNYPALQLCETVTPEKDELYKSDRDEHRIAKKDGIYLILPSFFEYYYSENKLSNSIVYASNCCGFGEGTVVDYNLSFALTNSGADVVVGFHNSAFIAYNMYILATMSEELLIGSTVIDAMTKAQNEWGFDDITYAESHLIPEALDNDNHGEEAAFLVIAGEQDKLHSL